MAINEEELKRFLEIVSIQSSDKKDRDILTQQLTKIFYKKDTTNINHLRCKRHGKVLCGICDYPESRARERDKNRSNYKTSVTEEYKTSKVEEGNRK